MIEILKTKYNLNPTFMKNILSERDIQYNLSINLRFPGKFVIQFVFREISRDNILYFSYPLHS